MQLALYTKLEDLTIAMAEVQQAFALKAVEFAGIIKMGRTQLQDAVPMPLGQEFGTHATTRSATSGRH